MKYSIPTDFQDSLIEKLDGRSVEELYGKLDKDFIGGGRPSVMLPSVSRQQLARHVRKCHKKGIEFNYLLNATCVGNREMTMGGSRKLKKLMDMLSDIGVDSVTVSLPYLLEYVKYNYPGIKVCVSVMAGVSSLPRAKYWESLGADKITLPTVSNLYRNFKLLRVISENVSCEIKLIANLTCLYECPLWQYHSGIHSHASQSGHSSRGFFMDYCFLKCNIIKLENPVEFIRSCWIRPEDIPLYEEMGVDLIKFANRGIGHKRIIQLVDTYIRGRYEGNLLSLFLNTPEHYSLAGSEGFIRKLQYLFRPFSVNMLKMARFKNLIEDNGIYIDNRSLDGFLEHFISKNCHTISCRECSYCEETARRAIRINEKQRKKALHKYRACHKSLVSGDVFRYIAGKR